jgi:hypothetical protein
MLDKFRLVQTEKEIHYQAPGFNTQADKDEPGHSI